MWAKTRKDGFLLDGASRGLASAARRKGLAGHSQQRHGVLLRKSAGIPSPRVAVGAVVPIRHHRRAASIRGAVVRPSVAIQSHHFTENLRLHRGEIWGNNSGNLGGAGCWI